MANLERWKNGETGFPIVDAAMRELRETGFMHNRTRMITAMFLTKDLHLDWRHGESYFMQMLTDGEIASNNGGWRKPGIQKTLVSRTGLATVHLPEQQAEDR